MLNRKQTIQQMNIWGAIGQPFYFAINFDASHCYLTTIEKDEDVRFSFHKSDKNIHGDLHRLSFEKTAIDPIIYQKAYESVVAEIQHGNSFLVNLTLKTPIRTNLTLLEIFEKSRAKYKVWFDNQFVCFSPETFVKTSKGKIFSHPMKGTINADTPNAEKIIMNDAKETAEHVTIVDLIRNDLSQVAKDVTVDRFRYIDEVKTHEKTLLQVSSEISGKLPPLWQHQIGSMLYQLLPAGSITGAPKPKTLKIIEENETYERGFYTGICGYFDGEELDTGVMIRFIEQENNQLYFKSGGGITAFSNMESEYQETLDKIYVPVY